MEEFFRFRKFSVRNTLSGLKVGTDAVLLGASVHLQGSPSRILDIGTGTGIIALMLAQRLSDAGLTFHITGIDIDAGAFEEASLNFKASSWNDSLKAVHISLQDFADGLYNASASGYDRYDLIVSNPPYYDNSLPSKEEVRSLSRHTESLSYREVMTFAADFLSPDGVLALVLPSDEERNMQRFAASFGLFPSEFVRVRTV